MRALSISVAVLVGTAGLAGTSDSQAQINDYFILDSSSVSDFRRIGGDNIVDAGQYSGFGGTVDQKDPSNWPGLHSDLGAWDVSLDFVQGEAPEPMALNFSNVNGLMTVVGGSVTGASISQLDPLSLGTLQTFNPDNIEEVNGTWQLRDGEDNPGVMTNLVAQDMVWVYNPSTNTLMHGNEANAACEVATLNGLAFGGSSGTQTSGQCSVLRGQVANGAAGSFFTWGGIAEGATVRDNREAPWGGGSTDNCLNFQGNPIPGCEPGEFAGQTLPIGPQTAVTWDLSGFVEGVGGTIIAHVTQFNSSGGGSGIAATYNLDLQIVPIPAAVWLFLSGLGLLAWVRRRAGAMTS